VVPRAQHALDELPADGNRYNGVSVDRNHLRALSGLRLREARTLLRAGLYDGAYYLSGYALECGLKACIASQTRRHDFPDLQRVRDSYVHDLEKLVRVAGLTDLLKAEEQVDPQFSLNWNLVRDWNETSRYARYREQSARDMFSAVASSRSGVMQWIRCHW
jgi:HEPN domain-containing protein